MFIQSDNERTPQVPPEIAPLGKEGRRYQWSVMIPAYNCIQYLRYAIESVLAQDQGTDAMQIEVIDDASTDGDVKTLVEDMGKGRVGYFRQDRNVGSLRNFETCLTRARGEWVHLLHGDDEVSPGYYQEIASLFKTYPKAAAAFTNYHFIDDRGDSLEVENDNILEKPGIIENFIVRIAERQLIQPPAIVVKRAVYEKLGSFYAVHFGEDWEMWSRIASQYPVAYSPRVLAKYRVANPASISHQSFLTGQNIKDISKVIDIIQGYVPPGFRNKTKNYARLYYSIYCIRIANGLLTHNTREAFIQVKGGLKMSKHWKTYYWAARFYLLYIFRIKQLQHLLQSRV